MEPKKFLFVSLTGYTHRASFGADRQELVIVDPSVDYRNRPAGQRFDRAVMAPAPTTLTGMLPQHAGFELRGLDIGAPSGSTVVIESIIVFE